MSLKPLHQTLAVKATDIQAAGTYVLVEANEAEARIGSIYLPLAYREFYPTSGWVYSVGPEVNEDVKPGDFVVIEEEGTAIDHTYYDVFEVTLRHEDETIENIFVPIEVEPILREQVERFRAGGEDRAITTHDKLNDGSIRFDCHNVVSWQFGQVANPQYNLSYVPTYMVEMPNEDDQVALFYFVDIRKILAVVNY